MSENYYATKDQLIDILKAQQVPVLGAGGGFAPIGTINFFDASVAPSGWLACDGSTHNISDYPELATFYASVHGSTNFYGGNGTTTFAVPDLRGEFLRGTGTNSHANQGNGANVGVHQDGTEHLITYTMNTNKLYYPFTEFDNNNDRKFDNTKGTNKLAYGSLAGSSSGSSFAQEYTSRPTNTSFLICVKATVAGDPNAHQYSTEEQILEMTSSGEYIYEKTITGLNIRLNWVQQYCADSSEIDPLIQNVGVVYSCNARCNGSTDSDINTTTNLPIILKRMNSSGKWKFRSYDDYIVKEVTIRYTKTQ